MIGSLKVGQYVRALAGRDKGGVFIVVGTAEGGSVYIADGKKRKIETPKKKKVIHLQKYNRISEKVSQMAEKGEELSNSLLRSELEGCI